MTIGTPFALATDGRRDDRDRHEQRGAAARARLPRPGWSPGLYGFISATKWITRITLTTYAEQDAVLDPAENGPPTPRSRSPAGSTPPGRCPPSTPAARSSAAWPRAQHQGGVEEVESASTAAPGRARLGRPAARTTGASGTPCRGPPGRAGLARRQGRHRRRRDPDRGAGDAVPERLQRHPGRRRHGPLKTSRQINPTPPRHQAPPAGRTAEGQDNEALLPPQGQRPRSGAHPCRWAWPPAAATPTPSPPAARKAPPPPRCPKESEPMADDASAETFGPGCAAIHTYG